ncbi:protein crumbs homolog 2b isoform X1 [Denticeps clupeoides]|nr:protein crumbs homolog 1-like isoform X1 [Denticeps clupeoides]
MTHFTQFIGELYRILNMNLNACHILTILLGILCTVSAEKCLSTPCQNGGSCIDTMGDYVCLCPTDPVRYVGKNCTELFDACAYAKCPNCVTTLGSEEYECTCPQGFAGPDCEEDIDECDSNPCMGVRTYCVHGVNSYTCYCPSGFGGENCQEHVRHCGDDPCFNGATCEWAGHGYQCLCPPGYQGNHCEEDIDECLSMPCRNGAICRDGMGLYECYCVPGFQGYNCEIDINECASLPCENNATCINGKDKYVCQCPRGFKGVNCELEIDECEAEPCQNGAACYDYVGLYVCECMAGYEGINCEVDIDECASAPCLHHGICLDLPNRFECDCSGTGFAGDVCEEDILECASLPCHNNATCVEGINQYSCLCWPGYEGENCQVDVDECQLQPCENGGQCFQRSDERHYGVLPELDSEFIYANAAGFLCHCLPGFTGENCSVNIDDCESDPCQNGGVCEDLISAYQCVCHPGFTGVLCDIDIDECESDPCKNGATCEDGVHSYTCLCPKEAPGRLPWGGPDCNTQLTGCEDHLCDNGATCIPHLSGEQHEYVCTCPAGFHGEFCSTPTTFSFSKPGFVLVELPRINRTRRDLEVTGPNVQLRFRTTLSDLILFYRGTANHFLSLEIVNGELRASAQTGDQKLEAKISQPVNDGLWHQAFVTMEDKLLLSVGNDANSSHWEEDSGHNHLLVFHMDDLQQVLIGGVQPEYLNNTVSKKGFIGCMEDLLIDFAPILPQSISQDQVPDFQIGCNKTEWCQPDPCSQQGFCVDLWSDYRCHCFRPFHGNSCSEEFPSWTFSHELDMSFASFPITQSHGGDFNVSFFLRSIKPSGLIFQLRRKEVVYFSVYLQDSKLHVNLHSSIRKGSTDVSTGEKLFHTVAVKDRFVFFNDEEAEFQTMSPSSIAVEAGDMAFVGGLPQREDLSPWGGFFKGCLQDIRLDHKQLFIYQNQSVRKTDPSYLPNTVYSIQPNCLSDEMCKSNPCQNGGECSVTWNDFTCKCPFNYTGRTCQALVWCKSNPCVMGSRCVDLADGYECLTNATFRDNALQFRANGTLSNPVTAVTMDLRTREENGVLLRATNGNELFCLALMNSSLLVKLRSGNSLEILAFISEVQLSDGDWHHVEVFMDEPRGDLSSWKLTVDGQKAGRSLMAAGSLDIFNDSTVWLAENFTGCLGEVRVGGVYLSLLEDDEPPQSARFTRQGGVAPQMGCSGSPVCLSMPCMNNGTCLDLFHAFSCACAPGWEGELCQNDTDECASRPCAHGTCRDMPAGYRCDCAQGYGGTDCREDVDECREHACENGGSCLDGVGSYSCVCPSGFSGPFCQWSFPPWRCEVDVQCANGGICTDGPWGANCTCKRGFTGSRCEVDIDECASGPCRNGATCVNDVNKYRCVCSSGFSGKHCELNKEMHKDRMPWVVVLIPLVCIGAILAGVGLVCTVLTTRRKRQSEGTYSPSSQEVAGARMEMGSVLKVPPEERLI